MPDLEIEHALSAVEESLHRFGHINKFNSTASPNIYCTSLPEHWRSNKSLPAPFIVLVLHPVPDGTKVTVAAGNEDNSAADVKNNEAEFIGQMARFSDLRFVGKSGRGKKFNVTITIHHQDGPREVAVLPDIIKVTVDGPRDSRNAANRQASQGHHFGHGFHPYDHGRKRSASTMLENFAAFAGSVPSTSCGNGMEGMLPKAPRLGEFLPRMPFLPGFKPGPNPFMPNLLPPMGPPPPMPPVLPNGMEMAFLSYLNAARIVEAMRIQSLFANNQKMENLFSPKSTKSDDAISVTSIKELASPEPTVTPPMPATSTKPEKAESKKPEVWRPFNSAD
uniref:Runt domain-containing protein n=1 Tax=Panagrellus redivivus TaxID=6233 RepID=A0A7E4VII0_PANRE